MATIHEITEDWQREGLSPTWVKLQAAQAEFDALQNQMESQKDEWLSWQAKREALEEDAARYRWLRDRLAIEDIDRLVSEFFGTPDEAESVKTDAAIDAAMKGE